MYFKRLKYVIIVLCFWVFTIQDAIYAEDSNNVSANFDVDDEYIKKPELFTVVR